MSREDELARRQTEAQCIQQLYGNTNMGNVEFEKHFEDMIDSSYLCLFLICNEVFDVKHRGVAITRTADVVSPFTSKRRESFSTSQ